MTAEDNSIYPSHILTIAKNTQHLGRLNGPDASSYVKGPCGDEMEFYLIINNNIGQLDDDIGKLLLFLSINN